MGRIQGILEYDNDKIHQYLQDTFAKSKHENLNGTHFANSIDSAGFDEIPENDVHSHTDSTMFSALGVAIGIYQV